MIKEILSIDFEKNMMNDTLKVVKFGASWCGSCKEIQPAFEKIAREETNVLFFDMDADKNVEFVTGIGIKSLPTFGFYKDGKLIHLDKSLHAYSLKAKIDELK